MAGEGVLNYVNLWPFSGPPPLNGGPAALSEEAQTGADLSAALRKSITALYGAHVTEDGGGVDYAGLAGSEEFEEYKVLARRLKLVDVGSMGEDEKVAFFVNTYNSLLIHAFAELGTPGDMLSRLRLYAVARYDIGGHTYTLNEIENGVLRGNARPPTPNGRAPFSDGDPRKGFACARPDPRIHFALNCGARGCPAIRFYKPERLDADLGRAAEAFCAGAEVDEGGGRVRVSQIFKWYWTDFAEMGDNEGLVRYILGHSKGQNKEALERLLAMGGCKVEHVPYDWSLNSKK
uniref:DUF547 domain-containing protein n=1 Tax=Hemiselmis andersenii TaxID=464988 RepID=A0A7S1H3S0_HEMAN